MQGVNVARGLRVDRPDDVNLAMGQRVEKGGTPSPQWLVPPTPLHPPGVGSAGPGRPGASGRGVPLSIQGGTWFPDLLAQYYGKRPRLFKG